MGWGTPGVRPAFVGYQLGGMVLEPLAPEFLPLSSRHGDRGPPRKPVGISSRKDACQVSETALGLARVGAH